MFSWSVGLISKLVGDSDFMYGALVVSSLNMLIQLVFDFICGGKAWSKLGGWYRD